MKALIILLSIFAFGCSQTSVSGSATRSCVQGRLCESASDTGCYSSAVYELDPMGIVGDNYLCTKN